MSKHEHVYGCYLIQDDDKISFSRGHAQYLNDIKGGFIDDYHQFECCPVCGFRFVTELGVIVEPEEVK